MYAAKLAAVVALCALGSQASDVYTSFLDSDGNAITGTNFDIANTGCFSVGPAYSIKFSQASSLHGQTLEGPYCLRAWADGGCPGTERAKREYSNVINGGQYQLADGISAAGSYQWQPNAC